jgi:NADPH:quinone reductase-like Zn-dependent oxidoreductase
MTAIPDTMRALALLHDGFGADPTGQRLETLEPYVALQQVPVPGPGPGQALVRVACAAVNPSDVAFIKGLYGQKRRKGVAAGFEGTGTVVAGETDLIGRRVSFFGSGTGTWAEYALTDAAGLIPLRDDVRDEDAAGLIVNPVTAAAMFDLVRAAGTPAFVATAATSQLGKFLCALGRDGGIPCLAHVRRGGAAEALRAHGAAEVLATDADGYGARMRAAMEAYRPTVLLDAVAGPASAELFFAMPDGARWVCYGRLSAEPPVLGEMAQFIFRGKRIEGFWLTRWMQEAGRAQVAATVGEVQARFASGAWATDVSEVVPLGEAMARLPEAYGAKDAKVLIAP